MLFRSSISLSLPFPFPFQKIRFFEPLDPCMFPSHLEQSSSYSNFSSTSHLISILLLKGSQVLADRPIIHQGEWTKIQWDFSKDILSIRRCTYKHNVNKCQWIGQHLCWLPAQHNLRLHQQHGLYITTTKKSMYHNEMKSI